MALTFLLEKKNISLPFAQNNSGGNDPVAFIRWENVIPTHSAAYDMHPPKYNTMPGLVRCSNNIF